MGIKDKTCNSSIQCVFSCLDVNVCNFLLECIDQGIAKLIIGPEGSKPGLVYKEMEVIKYSEQKFD